jgi:hypothetical protein
MVGGTLPADERKSHMMHAFAALMHLRERGKAQI